MKRKFFRNFSTILGFTSSLLVILGFAPSLLVILGFAKQNRGSLKERTRSPNSKDPRHSRVKDDGAGQDPRFCFAKPRMTRPLLPLLFTLLLILLTPTKSYAIYEGVRSDIGYDSSDKMCDTGTIAYTPFGGVGEASVNDDLDWDFSNPSCIAFMAGSGTAVNTTYRLAQINCMMTGDIIGAMTDAIPLSPLTVARQISLAARCTQLSATPATAYAAPSCCAWGVGAYNIAIAASLSALATVHTRAKVAYDYARICGHDWYEWTKDDDGNWTKDKGEYQKCLIDLFTGSDETDYTGCGSNSSTSITNPAYREYIYGGKEYEGDCKNPSSWSSSKKEEILGYSNDNQRYYMTGPGNTPVFACYRFLTSNQDEATREAYDCCVDKSQKSLCIENRGGLEGTLRNYGSKFCDIGSKCKVGDVIFEVYASKKQLNYACARTYDVCPYNHLLGGGTETEQMKSSDTSQVENFCQFMNHCQKLPLPPYVRTTDMDGAFISSACRDMKGDSQNVYGYTAQLVPINTRGFTAPLVQCFKETMENLFLHKAGYTQCLDPDEYADSDGVCASGDYAHRKGDSLPGDSFFIKIQNELQDTIKMVLSLSVIFFGVVILLGLKPIEKKQLLPYILKIGLVMYFAVGDAWQSYFMSSVIDASSYISDIVFNPDESSDESKLDGCQFPRFNYADDDEDTKYDDPAYPPGDNYLRAWDTFDCKIARALGFGPEVSVPNLIFMILGGFLTGGMGMIFVVASFCFAFFLISVAIRAMHIFLLSTTSVIILIYVSPITITLAMFSKTKSIFDGWLKRLLSYTLQPMILFAYLGIFLTLFDSLIMGDLTFSGTGKSEPKTIHCGGEAENSSVYCIFNVADIKTLHGLEVLGIGLPTLTSMNKEKLNTIIKAAILMFIFMTLLEKITALASELTGDFQELKSDWKVSAGAFTKEAYGKLQGLRERANRGAVKHGGKAFRSTMEGPRKVLEGLGDKGKKTQMLKPKGTSHTTDSAAKERTSFSSISPEEAKKGEEKKKGENTLPSHIGSSPSSGGNTSHSTNANRPVNPANLV